MKSSSDLLAVETDRIRVYMFRDGTGRLQVRATYSPETRPIDLEVQEQDMLVQMLEKVYVVLHEMGAMQDNFENWKAHLTMEDYVRYRQHL